MSVSQKNREPGFYWVKFAGYWQVAYWSNFNISWYLASSPAQHSDNDFSEIDERRIVREGPAE